MVWPGLAAVLGGFHFAVTSCVPNAVEHHIHLLDNDNREGMHLVKGHGHGLLSSFPVYISLARLGSLNQEL